MVGPGSEIAGGGGGRAPRAGREQVIDALKAAFVQGRLDKDEFDLRVSKVLAAYAELDALTADIPAGPPRAQARAPEPARESHNRKVIQRGTAAGAGASVAFTVAGLVAAGAPPVLGLVLVPLAGAAVAVLLAGLLTLLSWVLERGATRPPSAATGRSGPPGGTGEPMPVRQKRDLQGRSRGLGGDAVEAVEAAASTAMKSLTQPLRYCPAGRSWPGTAALSGPPG
jgi:Domain of unknown function (DUF1707)